MSTNIKSRLRHLESAMRLTACGAVIAIGDDVSGYRVLSGLADCNTRFSLEEIDKQIDLQMGDHSLVAVLILGAPNKLPMEEWANKYASLPDPLPASS